MVAPEEDEATPRSVTTGSSCSSCVKLFTVAMTDVDYLVPSCSATDRAQRFDREHLRRLRAFAYRMLGSRAEAEDIVQDVLLRLFHSDCNLDRIDDVERYLWRAIANRCCDYHRHRRNATLPTERAAALADDSGDQELREEYERIAGLLATLPEEQAEVIRLKTSDSLTFARIAELTGSTEATVKSRFRYGIGKLRKLINH